MKKEDFIYASSIICSKWINKNKDPKSLEFKKILIIKLDEIGDVVNSLHVFELIKKEYPEAELTLWCKPFVLPLVKSDPNISKLITSKNELNKQYDLVIDLRGTFESIGFALGCSAKYRVDRGTIRLRNKYNGGQKHEVITNLQIIEPLLGKLPSDIKLSIYHSSEDMLLVENFIRENRLNKFAIFHCEARRELRKWNAEKFAATAKFLKEKYHFDILFAGDKNDAEAIDRIRDKIDFPTINVAGKFSLSAFATLTSKANFFIGNESGPLHIATASKCKSLGLYGPGVPVTFYPWGLNATFIHHVLDCNPCDQIHCVRPTNTCMDMITLMEVERKIVELLS
jgi:ADP-heptose:LPS heptosyltransferase